MSGVHNRIQYNANELSLSYHFVESLKNNNLVFNKFSIHIYILLKEY
jgi:hypothetical protein